MPNLQLPLEFLTQLNLSHTPCRAERDSPKCRSVWWELPGWVAAEQPVADLKLGLTLPKWQASAWTVWMEPLIVLVSVSPDKKIAMWMSCSTTACSPERVRALCYSRHCEAQPAEHEIGREFHCWLELVPVLSTEGESWVLGQALCTGKQALS